MRLPRHSLLEPSDLNGLPLRNRIVMAPLTRALVENPGHVPDLVERIRMVAELESL